MAAPDTVAALTELGRARLSEHFVTAQVADGRAAG